MSDPILLFLTLDAVALLLLGVCAELLPAAAASFLATIASGLGMLLCLPPVLLRASATTFELPVGPPGLSLHFALDAPAAFFLVIVTLAGTVLTAFQETAVPRPDLPIVRRTAFCLAGTMLTLLAADAVTLTISLAVTATAVSQPGRGGRVALLAPLFLLVAVCLLTPGGFAPRFDTIRAAPIDLGRAVAAAGLGLAGVVSLLWPAAGGWTRDVLTAGLLIPAGCYLLLRVIADLAGSAAQTGCGFVLLLGGGAIAVMEAWRAASDPDLTASMVGLTRRQAGLATLGIGLALIARAADLPAAQSFALTAALLAVFGCAVAGVVTTLAAHAIGLATGTQRLSRLGGLIHTMPVTSAALAAGVLGLSALPPGLGFASLWLLFQAILSAPRTGGLLFQLPLALAGAAIALSAALATAALIRLIGIPLLGRPRSPQGAGAREDRSPSRLILVGLGGLSVLSGILPGVVLWLLADPAIRMLSGAAPGGRIGLALLVPSSSSPGYLALPVLAVLALGIAAALRLPRGSGKETKPAGPWTDGMVPPVGLPFGEPAAQSAGQGFVPALPEGWLPLAPALPAMPRVRPPSASVGLWLMLCGSAVLLLVLALTG